MIVNHHHLMTCVIALKTNNNTVILGGDSFCGDEEVVDLCKAPKIYKINELGVGICGSVRSEQVLEKVLRKELSKKKTKITENWLKNNFTETLRDEMRNHGTLYECDSVSYLKDSNYIFALSGKIFLFDESFALWESTRQYVAIGSGRTFAMGALSFAVMNNLQNKEPKKVVVNTLQIASEHSPWVRGPFSTIEI